VTTARFVAAAASTRKTVVYFIFFPCGQASGLSF
jgi:hypothetical protein